MSGRTSLPGAAGALLCASLALAPQPAPAQTGNAWGQISRNVYRIPYANGGSVVMSQDYIDHGNTPAGDTGSMDMRSQSGAGATIVAPAAGQVIAVNDSRSECGCHANYGPCANQVQIQHANGEVSTLLHIQQNSATNLGIAAGVMVAQGQAIGVEGAVGWTCGSGGSATAGACVGAVPAGAGNCGAHLHWNVVRQDTNRRVNPMTCGISNNLYADDVSYTSATCTSTGCADDVELSDTTVDGFGTWRVYQATDTITADTLTVSDFASAVLHAGRRVRLMPGFRAELGGHFRAEIGPCNTTAPTQ